jgi:uncharacterized protein HemX
MAKPDAQLASSRGTTRRALVVVGVLALAGLAYAIARVDILRARIVAQEIAMEAAQRDNLALQSRLEALTSSTQNTATQLTQLRSELAALTDNFGDLHTRAEQAQRIAEHSETLYLLRLANDQLHLARDLDNAIDTLAAAETILRTSGEAALAAIHQQVLAQLTQLRALPRSEVARIRQQLAAAEQQVNSLPLAGLATNITAGTELSASGFTRAWAVVKRGMASLFVIKKTDVEVSAFIGADEQAMRRRHLQLLLLNARQATYLYDQSGYANALNDSLHWLDQNFDRTDPAVSRLRTQLNTLAQQNMAPPLPDLTPSIQALTRLAPSATASTP